MVPSRAKAPHTAAVVPNTVTAAAHPITAVPAASLRSVPVVYYRRLRQALRVLPLQLSPQMALVVGWGRRAAWGVRLGIAVASMGGAGVRVDTVGRDVSQLLELVLDESMIPGLCREYL